MVDREKGKGKTRREEEKRKKEEMETKNKKNKKNCPPLSQHSYVLAFKLSTSVELISSV